MIKIKINKTFNLHDTISCGQMFSFKETNGAYDVILDDRVINIYEKEGFLYISSNNEDDLESKVINFFDLNSDYDYINEYLIDKDANIKSAVIYSNGLKMIKQDPFETIIEYIISSNNGVPQITNSIYLLSKNYGKKVIYNNKEYFLFPKPSDLKDLKVEDYRNCKVGFRDKYLYEIVQKINNGTFDINKIYGLNTDDALNYLMENKGIGNKVASCILLFAYQKYDVFPIDTWVKKYMKKNYDIEGEKNIKAFSKKIYGKYSGIALQYMFNESRNKKD